MNHQFSLFSVKELAPKPQLKKIITRERMKEVENEMKKPGMGNAARSLSDLNDSLERLEKRIFNKKTRK